MKKKIAIILSVIIIVITFTVGFFIFSKADYVTNYGSSEIYTEQDMKDAIELIENKLLEIVGLKSVLTVSYAGDEISEKKKRSYRYKGYEEVIVFECSFLTNSNTQSLNPNGIYTGFNFIFGRNSGGSWQFITSGYA